MKKFFACFVFAPWDSPKVNDVISIDERSITERFVRATGPGGQNVNKVATAVELRLDIRRSSLPLDVQRRLTELGGTRVTADGVLVVVSREHRTQGQNRDEARARLTALVQRAVRPPKKRTPTRPGAGEREKRLVSKKATSRD